MRNLRNILYSYWQQKSSIAVVDGFLWAVQPCGGCGGGNPSFEKGIIPLFDHFFYDISQFFKMYVKWIVDSDIERIMQCVCTNVMGFIDPT